MACNLETTNLLDCALIGARAIIRSTRYSNFWIRWKGNKVPKYMGKYDFFYNQLSEKNCFIASGEISV